MFHCTRIARISAREMRSPKSKKAILSDGLLAYLMLGSVLQYSSYPETLPCGAAASGVKARSRRAFRMPMLEQNAR
ncbi:hypothetical protein ABA78_22185 [Serratia sp. TEL]|nr:hypothetical protein ABA78_22185 [Serratia sp. TEL]